MYKIQEEVGQNGLKMLKQDVIMNLTVRHTILFMEEELGVVIGGLV